MCIVKVKTDNNSNATLASVRNARKGLQAMAFDWSKNMIQITLPDTLVETVVRGIMENFPEASNGCSLVCTKWKYDAWQFRFEDFEGERGQRHTEYDLDKAKLLAAFPLIFTDKWPKGCTQPPASDNPEVWDDWLCQCDATDFDAFAQLACMGEVIYG